MKTPIRGPQDFGAGMMYMLFGATAIYLAREYGMGSVARMGPGYFPTVLGALLCLFGAIAVLRSFVSDGAGVGAIAWKALASVTASVLAFALLLKPAGFPIAMVVLLLVSASSSMKFKLGWRPLVLLLALVAACGLVFVKGLGVPMPLLGYWFGA